MCVLAMLLSLALALLHGLVGLLHGLLRFIHGLGSGLGQGVSASAMQSSTHHEGTKHESHSARDFPILIQRPHGVTQLRVNLNKLEEN